MRRAGLGRGWGGLGGPVAPSAGGLFLTGSVDMSGAEARGYLEAGFRGMKMGTGLPRLADDLSRVEAVRAEIGPDVALRLARRRLAIAPKTALLAPTLLSSEVLAQLYRDVAAGAMSKGEATGALAYLPPWFVHSQIRPGPLLPWVGAIPPVPFTHLAARARGPG